MIDFEVVLHAHIKRYPRMQPQDCGKLAYQSTFGPEHMIVDAQEATERILYEWQTVIAAEVPCNPEPIGNGLCRFHMTADSFSPDSAAELAKLFVQSAREHTSPKDGLETRLKLLANLSVDGMDAWLSAWRAQGCPPVHHSEPFRAAYQPHYRILRIHLADRLAQQSR